MKKITLLFLLLSISFGYSQVPTTAAPTPPARNSSDVISIYGSAYTNISGVNTNPNWGQSTVVTEVSVGGDNALQYANFNYQGTGWESNAQNVSTMEYLHVDVWTNNQAPNVYVISSGPEIAHPISSVPGSWQSLNIPVAGLTGNSSNVIQFKFDGGNGGTIYLDNLYFWKTPVAAGTDATLSDLKVDGNTVLGFSASVVNYTVGVGFGSPIPQITAATTTDTNATRVITQASSVPGNATVVVTSQNGSVTKTYTVSYVIMGPTTPAPTPPARNANDVISLFSNAYSNIVIDTWSAVWDDSNYTDLQISGNDTKKIDFGNFIGVDFSGAGHHQDLTAMTRFHMDFYTDNADLVGKVFNSKISQWGGGAGEVSAAELNINTGTTPAIVTGSWVSIDVPMTQWVNNPTRNDIAQFLITSNLGTVYVDNIYFYKENLATNSYEISNAKMYPNPTKNSFTVESKMNIQQVSVYNVLGQEVISSYPNSISATIDLSSFTNGVYFVKTNVEGIIETSKVIKE